MTELPLIERSSIDEIRARAEIPVFNQLSGPKEYYRVQQLLRDRADLLSHYDELAKRLAPETSEPRSPWEETAAQFCRNMEYYRGLVDRIGRAIGPEAYVADDGSVSEDVLRAKVPEIIERLLIARPANEWHEDLHDVLWWRFPIEEPPYCGSPLDTHWQEHELEKAFTHWSPVPIPTLARGALKANDIQTRALYTCSRQGCPGNHLSPYSVCVTQEPRDSESEGDPR